MCLERYCVIAIYMMLLGCVICDSGELSFNVKAEEAEFLVMISC